MEEFAQKMDQEEINTVYCFGDNPLSDIYGANLFTETLEKVNRNFIKNWTRDEMIIFRRNWKEIVTQLQSVLLKNVCQYLLELVFTIHLNQNLNQLMLTMVTVTFLSKLNYVKLILFLMMF